MVRECSAGNGASSSTTGGGSSSNGGTPTPPGNGGSSGGAAAEYPDYHFICQVRGRVAAVVAELCVVVILVEAVIASL